MSFICFVGIHKFIFTGRQYHYGYGVYDEQDCDRCNKRRYIDSYGFKLPEIFWPDPNKAWDKISLREKR